MKKISENAQGVLWQLGGAVIVSLFTETVQAISGIKSNLVGNVQNLLDIQRRLLDVLSCGGDIGEATTMVLLSDYNYQKRVVDAEKNFSMAGIKWKKVVPKDMQKQIKENDEILQSLITSNEALDYFDAKKKKSIFSKFFKD